MDDGHPVIRGVSIPSMDACGLQRRAIPMDLIVLNVEGCEKVQGKRSKI